MSIMTYRNHSKARASAVCILDVPVFWSAGPVKGMLAAKVLGRKEEMKIAGWNVRTFRDEGTKSITAKTMHQYGIGDACLSEVRLPDVGHKLIKVFEVDSIYHLYHSGVTKNSGMHGVAIALNLEAQAALLVLEPILHRLARIRLKGSIVNVSVISVYALTLNATEDDKDVYYHDLQAAVDRT